MAEGQQSALHGGHTTREYAENDSSHRMPPGAGAIGN